MTLLLFFQMPSAFAAGNNECQTEPEPTVNGVRPIGIVLTFNSPLPMGPQVPIVVPDLSHANCVGAQILAGASLDEALEACD
ncbi:MAG: hypothetical protein OXH70_16420 [Acidobacteria bacterium]|nr:hypothetical protein [Acidobacteriota bacterium]